MELCIWAEAFGSLGMTFGRSIELQDMEFFLDESIMILTELLFHAVLCRFHGIQPDQKRQPYDAS